MNYVGKAKYRCTKAKILDKKRRQSHAMHCLRALIPPIHRPHSPSAAMVSAHDGQGVRIDELDREVLALIDGKPASDCAEAPRKGLLSDTGISAYMQPLSAITSSGEAADVMTEPAAPSLGEPGVEAGGGLELATAGDPSMASHPPTEPWTTPRRRASESSSTADWASIWSVLREHDDRLNNLASCIANISKAIRRLRDRPFDVSDTPNTPNTPDTPEKAE